MVFRAQEDTEWKAILCLVCGIGWGVYEHYANVKKPLVLYGNVDIRQVSLAFQQ